MKVSDILLPSLKGIADLSALFTLDRVLKDAVRSLTAPGLVVATVDDHLARVEEFFSSNPHRPSADLLRFGTEDQKQVLVTSLACRAPIQARLSNLFSMLPATGAPGAMASYLGRLCRAVGASR